MNLQKSKLEEKSAVSVSMAPSSRCPYPIPLCSEVHLEISPKRPESLSRGSKEETIFLAHYRAQP